MTKGWIWIIYIVFFVAMYFTIKVAFNNYEGLVVDDYYNKAKGYYTTKDVEAKANLRLKLLTPSLKEGHNDISIQLHIKDEYKNNSKFKLFIGSVSSKDHDRYYPVELGSDNILKAKVHVPNKGKWLCRIELDSANLKTEKRWFLNAY